LPIFWGDGANGKTTFIRALLTLMGDYGATAPPDLLVVKKHKEHPTELMVLMGARFAATVETPLGAFLNETLVKNLTGNDTITARWVFKNFVSFTPTHKLLMATNHQPAIRGTDNAIWRRLLLVPFAVTIRPEDQDVHLLDKLTLELPGILNWAVQGCTDWQDASLDPPPQVRVATDSYRQESDHLPGFLDEACVIQPFTKVEKGAIFVAYTNWCQRNGETPMPKLELGRRFKALGLQGEKSNGRRFWKGIGLVPKDPTP
jgi:putative DNA primase/helicase